jgi:hypothetical protein
VLASMVRTRGVPGSPTHEEVRGKQRDIAGLPTHHQLAAVVVSRLSRLPLQGGTSDIAPLIAPVSSVEYQLHGPEAGTRSPLP